MLRVSMHEAAEGMRLAMPVYHPQRGGPVLLKADVVLDGRLIARLREINLREIYIHYPDMSFLSRFASPAIMQARAELSQHVLAALDEVAANAVARLDYSSYKRAVVALIEQLVHAPTAAYYLEELATADTPQGRHANSVCFLSVLMGLKLGDYLIAERPRLHPNHARDVTSLGVGAMLHDVGMLRLPPEALRRWNREHDQSDPHWQRHVKLGYDMIRDGVDPSAAAVVLHHHQAHDGSGFPRRKQLGGGSMPLKGSEIHAFARIVAVADTFDRLRDSGDAPGADSVPQTRRSTVSVLREMVLGETGKRFDPMVIKALIACVPAYSPGSVVTLSDGRRAVVCNWRSDDPCRPRVLPIEGFGQAIGAKAQGSQVFDTEEPKEIVDLASLPDLQIVEAEGFDVAKDNFVLPSNESFDLRQADRERINRAQTLEPT